MLLLRADKLPEGDGWQYELKFDGYRALAFKTSGKIQLRSRNDNDFSLRYLPSRKPFRRSRTKRSSTVKFVALDESGKPSFNTLQNHAGGAEVHFFVFDVLVLRRSRRHGRAADETPRADGTAHLPEALGTHPVLTTAWTRG
jgi:bifunctional non-homologous end joining protein LigD